MKQRSHPPESALADAVIALFPTGPFRCITEAPLGRKRIDLLFIASDQSSAISVELKVADWKKALWQAVVNFQIANESYIAMWHLYVHRAEAHLDTLRSYGIGLISVDSSSARIVLQSKEPVRRIPRSDKVEWYRSMLAQHRRGVL